MFDGIINALKAFLPKGIGLVIALLIARLIYDLVGGNGIDINGLIHMLAVTVAASLLTVVTVAALDSYNSAE